MISSSKEGTKYFTASKGDLSKFKREQIVYAFVVFRSMEGADIFMKAY